MQTGLIIAALRKHRLATLLIAMEIALACAVLCNAIFMLTQKGRVLNLDSGIAESSLGIVQLSGFDAAQAADLNARVTGALHAIQGVTSAPFRSVNRASAQAFIPMRAARSSVGSSTSTWVTRRRSRRWI